MLKDELSNFVSFGDVEFLLARIDQEYFDFASVIRVDDTGSDVYVMSKGKATSGSDASVVSWGNGNGET